MKKAIGTVLALALLFAAPSCSSAESSGTESAFPAAAPETEPSGVAVQPETPPTESTQESTEQEATEMKLKIQVGDVTFTATLAENSSVEALKALMGNAPLTLDMHDYANMEKGADLGVTLPQNNEPMNPQAGDIILYQGRTLVIYYDTNAWSLTPIGKIDNVDAESLQAALGSGDVTVTLRLE